MDTGRASSRMWPPSEATDLIMIYTTQFVSETGGGVGTFSTGELVEAEPIPLVKNCFKVVLHALYIGT